MKSDAGFLDVQKSSPHQPLTILKSGLLNKKWFLDFLIISAAAFLISCGKKKETQSSQTNSPAAPSQPAPAAAAPAPAAPAPPPAAADSYDAVVTARSIDFLQGRVARKDWPQAREALKQVQGRSLTPEQRSYVDSLKAQIPR